MGFDYLDSQMERSRQQCLTVIYADVPAQDVHDLRQHLGSRRPWAAISFLLTSLTFGMGHAMGGRSRDFPRRPAQRLSPHLGVGNHPHHCRLVAHVVRGGEQQVLKGAAGCQSLTVPPVVQNVHRLADGGVVGRGKRVGNDDVT